MKHEPHIIFDRQPDPLETKVRFVCGALFGLLPAVGMVWKFGPFSGIGCFAIFTLCVGTCAYLALRYGDDFWTNAIEVFRIL